MNTKNSYAILNKCAAAAKMGDRLATIDMGQKLGCLSDVALRQVMELVT